MPFSTKMWTWNKVDMEKFLHWIAWGEVSQFEKPAKTIDIFHGHGGHCVA
jgi:hypothetical protein